MTPDTTKIKIPRREWNGPAGLDFMEALSDSDEPAERVNVAEFHGDNEQAQKVRRERIIPAVRDGKWVVVDFSGVRTPTQSFVHALLYEVMLERGSLVRLSFLGCTRSAMEVLRVVAAYASYKQIV